jgi:hypothetical protein
MQVYPSFVLKSTHLLFYHGYQGISTVQVSIS